MSTTLAPKDPNVPATYSINWHDQLVREPRRDFDFASGVFVRPQRGTGFYYECTTAGRTSAYYPVWPREAAQTIADGSVVWTTRAPSASIPDVSTAVWTVPSGITKDSQLEDGPITYITLSGGTDGEDYDILCRMTPSSGNVAEQTITVPVRSQ